MARRRGRVDPACLCVTTFLGLYRVLRLGWQPQQAFALMREVWEPDETWSAFIESMLAKRPGIRPQ